LTASLHNRTRKQLWFFVLDKWQNFHVSIENTRTCLTQWGIHSAKQTRYMFGMATNNAVLDRQSESLVSLFARLTDELTRLFDAKLKLLRQS
jgi:hypothetical protein